MTYLSSSLPLWLQDTYVMGYPLWKAAIALHVFCWIMQFIGHGVFEGETAICEAL